MDTWQGSQWKLGGEDSATRLPGVREAWSWHTAKGNEGVYHVIISVLLALLAVFLCCLHRSRISIIHSRSGKKGQQHSLILSVLIPTTSLCLIVLTPLLPRSSLLFLSLSKVARLISSYLYLTTCVHTCGGHVCALTLTHITLRGSLATHGRKQHHLTMGVRLLTMEMLLTMVIHLGVLVMSYDKTREPFPRPLLSLDPLITCYYTVTMTTGVLGVAAACYIVREMNQSSVAHRIPLLMKAVSLLLVILESGLTVTVSPDITRVWQESVVLFLSRNTLVGTLVQFCELICVITLNNSILRRADIGTPVRVVLQNQREEPKRVRITLNREDSRELLRALNLSRSCVRFDEGVKVRTIGKCSRGRQDSFSSVATVC